MYNQVIVKPRIVILIAAFWTLLGSPALCSAGYLLHPCVCEEAESEGDACAHETECDGDPCDVVSLAARPEKENGIAEGLSLAALIPSPVILGGEVPGETLGNRALSAPFDSNRTGVTPLRL